MRPFSKRGVWILWVAGGCGSSDAILSPAIHDAGVSDATADAGSEDVRRIPEASADAGADVEERDALSDAPSGDGCVAPEPASTTYASGSCEIAGPCPTCADGLLYRCQQRLGAAQPGLWSASKPNDPPASAGCRQLSNGGTANDSEFCCPQTCTRTQRLDEAACNESSSGYKAVSCPMDDAGVPTVQLPAGCSGSALKQPNAFMLCCK